MTNVKFAFSTNAYLKFSFAEAARRLAKIGYAGVEIMADVPHAWPACLLEEQKQAIRHALAENRLAISNVIGEPSVRPPRTLATIWAASCSIAMRPPRP